MKISIITAALNAERYLSESIESVINQTYKNIELIIVDGKSSDNSSNIYDKYKDHIDILISETDQGVYDAFNKGIRVATGDVVFFLNADDYLIDDHAIEDVMLKFIELKDIQIVYGDVVWLFENGANMNDNHEITVNRLRKGFVCPHQGTFYKKSLLDQIGGFDRTIEYVADAEIIIKQFLNNPTSMFHFERYISFFRVGGMSTNKKNRMRLIRIKTHQIKRYFGLVYATHYYIHRMIDIGISKLIKVVKLLRKKR